MTGSIAALGAGLAFIGIGIDIGQNGGHAMHTIARKTEGSNKIS